jgi:hypothetical protein
MALDGKALQEKRQQRRHCQKTPVQRRNGSGGGSDGFARHAGQFSSICGYFVTEPVRCGAEIEGFVYKVNFPLWS